MKHCMNALAAAAVRGGGEGEAEPGHAVREEPELKGDQPRIGANVAIADVGELVRDDEDGGEACEGEVKSVRAGGSFTAGRVRGARRERSGHW